MADIFREVSNEGWLGRIGGSIKGVFVGGILALICVVALFWNEGRAVNEAKRIDEGQTACVSVDSAKVDPANENKLVHISGDAATTDKPTDKIFGVSAAAIRLSRTVEMYQWQEKKKTEKKTKLGGGEEKVTTYTYSKVWDEDLADSSDFKHSEGHENPRQKPFPSTYVNASAVNVGAFKLSPGLIDKMDKYVPLTIDAQSAALPEKIKSEAKFKDGGIYIGDDPETPSVGDTRVKFEIVEPGPVSVIAQQTASTFQPYISAHGETLMLDDGIKSAEQMFQAAKARNAKITWLIRGGGFVVMWIGLMMLVRPLKVVSDVLPFFGNLVGFASGLIMLLVAAVVSLVTIAIAWLVYRPVLGIGLLVVAGGLVALIIRAKKRATPKIQGFASMPPPPPPIPS